MAAAGLTIGAWVEFCLSAGNQVGDWRPAIVVRDWGHGTVNLLVMTDGANDYLMCPLWVTSVVQGDGPGCWRPTAGGSRAVAAGVG